MAAILVAAHARVGFVRHVGIVTGTGDTICMVDNCAAIVAVTMTETNTSRINISLSWVYHQVRGYGRRALSYISCARWGPMIAKSRLPNVYDVVMKDDLPQKISTKWNNDVQTDRFDRNLKNGRDQMNPSTRHAPDG